MSCSTTDNTFVKDYKAVIGSRLSISWYLEAPAGTNMNLTGYQFRLEVCIDKDFIDTTIPDSVLNITTNVNTYLFNIDFVNPYTQWTYYYRVSMKDSTWKLFPEALRAWRFIISN